MNYKLKLQLLIIPLVLIPVAVVSFVYIQASGSALMALQRDLMNTRLDNLLQRGLQEHETIERLGLSDVFFYLNGAQQTLIDRVKSESIPGGYVFIIDNDGELVYHPNLDSERTIDTSSRAAFIDIIAATPTGEIQYSESLYGDPAETYIGYWKTFDEWNWRMVATASQDAINEPIARSTNLSIITLLLILFPLIFVIYLFARNMSRPLEELKQYAMQFGKGNLGIRAKIRSKDEVGVLAHEFNEMASSLERDKRQLTDLNLNLENKIEDRTRELRESKDKVERARQEIDVEKNVALEASQSKSDFLAMMSHEMRTPMNGILGMVQLLGKRYPVGGGDKMSADEKEEQEYLEAITDSSKSLMTLMNSVLDFSKYDMGKMKFEYADFNLRRLLNGVMFLLSTSAEQRNNAFSLDLSTELPSILHGDAEKLRQVLINLLSNAIKFTKDGTIQLTVATISNATEISADEGLDENDHGTIKLLVTVTDSGIGIPIEAKAHIFDPFTQAGASISKRFGGSGLGLAICKQIVEQQDGSVSFTSEEGKGSTFTVRLDFQPGSRRDSAAQHGLATSRHTLLKVLVVDDLVINQKLAKAQLEAEGHNVFLASDGSEALEIIEHQSIDVVLMDLFMPVLDGIETTRALRQFENQNIANVPIIGVTANLNTETEKKCIEAGMDTVTAKPLTAEKLMRLFSEVGLQAVDPSAHEEIEQVSSKLIDTSLLTQHRTALGEGKFIEMYVDAESTANDYLKQIELAFENEDYEELKATAHTLAGLSANFGLVGLDAIVSELEENADQGDKDCLRKIVGEVVLVNRQTFQAIRDAGSN